MRIALVGTRGVPARYGGFETCVEEVGKRLAAAGHDVVVYCRRLPEDDPDALPNEYEGMRLVHLPAVRRKSLETLTHSAVSVAHLVANPTDVAIVFNAANAIFLPFLRARGIPVATHVDGLEWKRSKWQGAGRTYYRFAESAAVRWSDALISDAPGISEYYRAEFSAATELIAYGAPVRTGLGDDLIEQAGLASHGYHLVVARFEPENHVDVIVDGYRRSDSTRPLVVVGAAPYADAYTERVKSLADDRVRFLGAVWDQQLLDQLYAHSYTYLHGHSVGGTNPSLLRAIGAAAATVAYDVNFNRDVLSDAGRYFTAPSDLATLLNELDHDAPTIKAMSAGAVARAGRYDWDDVAESYGDLCAKLYGTGRRSDRERLSGRRLTKAAS